MSTCHSHFECWSPCRCIHSVQVISCKSRGDGRVLYLLQSILLLCIGLAIVTGTKLEQYDCLGMLMFMVFFFVQDATMLSALTQITWINVISVFGLHAIAVLGECR